MRFNILRAGAILAACIALSGCTESVSRYNNPKILTMGDSLLAWNRLSGKSVSEAVERFLGKPVVDRSVSGARYLYKLPITGSMGMKIESQYRYGFWDWVILNGGGNDLWLGCGCSRCDHRMDRLITADGTAGAIPDTMRLARASGARVVYVGYLRSPGVGSPIEHCRNEGDELERRITLAASKDPGVHFLSLKDLVPHGSRAFHAFDMIHPSERASTAIGERIAKIIAENPIP